MNDASLLDILRSRFRSAIAQISQADAGQVDPQVRPVQDPRFGDYQCNVAMSLAKSLRAKPRDVADRMVAAVAIDDLAEPLEVAGPGFINIRLKTDAIQKYLNAITAPPPTGETDRFGIPPAAQPRRVIVDYSSPNIAKEMHVGHLRSTIIGDVFARVLSFEGHEVIRQNHVGDWGTGIGMVITGLWYIRSRLQRGETDETVHQRREDLAKRLKDPIDQRKSILEPICREWSQDLRRPDLNSSTGRTITLSELELGYVFVQTLMSFAEGSGATVTNVEGVSTPLVDIPRLTTKMLQERDSYEIAEWQDARRISLAYCQHIYDRLGVLLTPDDVRGESLYDFELDLLPRVVEELKTKFAPKEPPPPGPRAELRVDEGALCIFLYDEKGEPSFKTPEGDPLPVLIQKSDGAYLYMTTDLAAIPYRLHDLKFPSGRDGAERVIYVTDARQKQRFVMLFEIARLAGWIAPGVSLEHVTFGSVLGEDRKPLKTRTGQNIKLGELLDEAERRAYDVLQQRERGETHDPAPASDRALGENVQREIANRVGIASVKYADLARDRNTDYVFNWDKMLAMQGNTAPYMMYAYARIRSIYRKAAEQFQSPDVYAADAALVLSHPNERALGLRLAQLSETIDSVATDLAPHVLCGYLYDLASDFMRFYESCPVVQAEDKATRASRMRLCDLAARGLRLGMGLLGIDVIERM